MKAIRPLAVLVVFTLEISFLFIFRDDLRSFASSVNDLDLFNGLGTLLFPAPIAFLLWCWRDADKQRELQNDAVRLQNENEKLVLEKRILEGEAAVAREKVDKANLEKQLLDVQSKLDDSHLERKKDQEKISVLERDLKELESLETEAILELLSSQYADGQPRSGADAHQAAALKRLFLTAVGQRMLKKHLEQRHFFAAPAVLEVFEEGELPEFEASPVASK